MPCFWKSSECVIECGLLLLCGWLCFRDVTISPVYIYLGGFETSAGVTMKSTISWVVTPCRSRCFGGIYRLYFQTRKFEQISRSGWKPELSWKSFRRGIQIKFLRPRIKTEGKPAEAGWISDSEDGCICYSEMLGSARSTQLYLKTIEFIHLFRL
jgi:hypothetical protein